MQLKNDNKAEEGKQGGEGIPYKDICVDEIQGLVEESEQIRLGDGFLGNWVEDSSSFLFFQTPSKDKVELLVKFHPDLELIDDYYFTYDQWQGGGLDSITIENMEIVPPWKRGEQSEGANLRILLDPGVVFGNGLHPTTRDCLRALIRAYRQRPFLTVLDLGTGTGILALAAAVLGAEKILASDLNPLCVKTARENVRLNHLCETIEVTEEKAEDLTDYSADMVVANIHYPVTKVFMQNRRHLEKDRVIVSGLMRSQYRELLSLLGSLNFKIFREWDHEMTWFTVLAERK